MKAMVTLKFGEKLKDLRLAAGLSCGQLADRSGMPAPTLYAYERHCGTPSLRNLLKITRALKVTLAEFENCAVPPDGREKRKRVRRT